MKNVINGRTIIIGITIFLVLVLVVFGFLYFKNLSNTHPIKTALSKIPVLSQVTSRQKQDPQEMLEKEKAKIQDEWDQIENQKRQLADKEAQLAQRESELEALEKQLEVEREKLETTLMSIKDLARYYEMMEPRNAASILENMDDELLIQLLRNMKKEVVSEILANLDAKRAAAITKKMSGL